MSEHTDSDRDSAVERDRVAAHITRAGARAGAPEFVVALADAAVHRAWQQSLRTRRGQRAARWVLAASVGVLAIGLAWWALPRGALRGDVRAGTVAALRGNVMIANTSVRGVSLAKIGQELYAKAGLTTGNDSGVRIVMTGATLTIAAQSDLTLDGPNVVRLHRGRVYVVGNADAAAADRIRVITPFGSVDHVGTRFEVQVQNSGLRVRVRDGAVLVANANVQQTLYGSESLAIDARGNRSVGFIEPFSSDWAWTLDLAPDFSLEGHSLADFLGWFAQVSGYTVSFASASVRDAARSALLHGSIAGLKPQAALEAVIAGTNLTFALTAPGECQISMRNPPAP